MIRPFLIVIQNKTYYGFSTGFPREVGRGSPSVRDWKKLHTIDTLIFMQGSMRPENYLKGSYSQKKKKGWEKMSLCVTMVNSLQSVVLLACSNLRWIDVTRMLPVTFSMWDQQSIKLSFILHILTKWFNFFPKSILFLLWVSSLSISTHISVHVSFSYRTIGA